MNHRQLVNQFCDELAKLSLEVEISGAMDHHDINKICEDVFCGVFREIYGFKNLRNLNTEQKKHFPGIDLADDEAKVAIQITSEKTIDKIKDSLTTFLNHNLQEKYDRIIFHILTEKQGSYKQSSIDKVTNGKIEFNVSRDILDKTDLATKAANVHPKNLKGAVNFLLSYMRGCEVGLSDKDFDPPEEPPEKLYFNLLEVYFPQTLYIAEILPEVFGSKRGRKPIYQRKHVRAYIKDLEITVPSDFEVNGGRLITFHNLENQDNPFSFLIDEGTIEPFAPSDYYSIDTDHERVFKSLLRFCMQQKLHKHRVDWKHEERLFIFLPLKDTDKNRKIKWVGEKQAVRTVYERKFKNNKPDEVLSTRHFAFSVSFLTLESSWYVSITSEWFFSYGDTYRASAFHDRLLSGLKRMEHNQSLNNQFRFLCFWLKDLDTDDLFSENSTYSQTITFGEIFDIDGGCYLDEHLWEPLNNIKDDKPKQSKLDFQWV